MELKCDVNPLKGNTTIDETKLNVKAKEFRPKQNVVTIAKFKIQEDIINEEHSE